ncbi:MAG TPA: hypothetical protein VGH92_00135 [Gaiellaceae bacterium]|jgi:hypothetical protein
MNEWPASENARAAMQLETTMRVLDAVGELRRDVDALRAEIPAKRTLAPIGTIARVAAESAILVAVAVLAGAGHFRPALTVALMGTALACVVLAEWLASRSAYVPRSFGFAQARQPFVVDPPVEAPLESDGWERGFFPETEPARL